MAAADPRKKHAWKERKATLDGALQAWFRSTSEDEESSLSGSECSYHPEIGDEEQEQEQLQGHASGQEDVSSEY